MTLHRDAYSIDVRAYVSLQNCAVPLHVSEEQLELCRYFIVSSLFVNLTEFFFVHGDRDRLCFLYNEHASTTIKIEKKKKNERVASTDLHGER